MPPLDNVNPCILNDVAGTTNAVVPKFKLLNQPLPVNVCTAVPLPVKVRLGALVALPVWLRVPNVNVLVTAASDTMLVVPVLV